MKKVLVDGHCVLPRSYCSWCRSHGEWRARVGVPEECPEGFTAESLPVVTGLGSTVERLVKPLGKMLGLGCLDGEGRLNPESPCGRRRDKLDGL